MTSRYRHALIVAIALGAGAGLAGPAGPASAQSDSMSGMHMTPATASPMPGMNMSNAMSANRAGLMQLFDSHRARMDMMRMEPRQMPGVVDLGVPMSREGSGTAWMPDATTVFGKMDAHGDDMFMTHGVGVLRYSDTTTARGSRTFNAPNWYMLMDAHPLSPASQFGARAMLTSDFATVGGYGYPLLFQSGESYHGQALHDKQHPHDLVSELSGSFSTLLSPHSTLSLYAGYPGEPALGPPTYMHRAIAYDMADAPIGHHWQDSTHITFGVLTAGFSTGDVKFEASDFTGREPNEIRTNFDPVHLDSTSARVSWNPSGALAAQVSYGFIKSPEALTPQIDQHRTTASLLYDRPLRPGEFFAASAVWGQNLETGGLRSNAYLLEADYHRSSSSVYTRMEFVQKSGTELVLDDATSADRLFPIGALTVGYVRDTRLPATSTVIGIGGQVTADARPGSLAAAYGPSAPLGIELFLRFRPAAMTGIGGVR